MDLIEDQLSAAERDRLTVRTDTGLHPRVPDRAHPPWPGLLGGVLRPADVAVAIETVDAEAWIPAVDGDAVVRDSAWVSELTGLLNLSG
ncbi:MAG: hypothetical protein ACM3ZF_14040 [Mycobacterium leprae]